MTLIEALQHLHDNPPSSERTDIFPAPAEYGICWNLKEIFTKKRSPRNGWPKNFYAYRFVSDNSTDWEHYSGNEAYPVPGSLSSEENNWLDDNLWQGEALAYRRSLLQHLIKKVSQWNF